MELGFPGGACIIRTYRETWKTEKITSGKDKGKRKTVGEPSKEIVYHISSLNPDKCSVERFGDYVREHWAIETYHGERDNGYYEDFFAHRCHEKLMSMMLMARSFGMWLCARDPEKTTTEVWQRYSRRPSGLIRILLKGGRL